MTHRRGLKFCALGLAVAWLVSCGHAGPRPSGAADRVERRLLMLERGFATFTSASLVLTDGGQVLEPEDALGELDKRVAELEALRLRYLTLLGEGASDRQRVVAMVRIAELHLDLGARIRRLPYPTDLPEAGRPAFDDRLSRVALPLEAVGFGVLEQTLDYADRRRVEGRFVRRARLYLALHAEQGATLTRRDLDVLRQELSPLRTFPAPRSLLEVGRVGQRAAR